MLKRIGFTLLTSASLLASAHALAQSLTVTPAETLETQGLTVMVDQNQFSPIFFDEKNAGIQIVLHGERIATDGAVSVVPGLGEPQALS